MQLKSVINTTIWNQPQLPGNKSRRTQDTAAPSEWVCALSSPRAQKCEGKRGPAAGGAGDAELEQHPDGHQDLGQRRPGLEPHAALNRDSCSESESKIA